jgi:F-type H+-transporting ATPase subunit epsilon
MAQQKLQLHILTPLGVIFDKEVNQVTATTTSGEITILVDHIPLVTTLTTGTVMVRTADAEPEYFTIHGGVLEKRHDNQVIILSSRSELAHEIDVARAQEAYNAAEKLMNDSEAILGEEYNNLQEVMTKELNRVNVGRNKGLRK